MNHKFLPSHTLAIGAAVVIAVAGAVLLVRSARHGGQTPVAPAPVPAGAPGQLTEQARQRLEQLRAALHGASARATRHHFLVSSTPAPASPPGGPAPAAVPPAPTLPSRAQPGVARLSPAQAATREGGQEPPPAAGDPSGPPPAASLAQFANDLPVLSRIALRDSDAERRLTAVTMLGASENPDAIPVLAQALADTDEEVRMAAVEALSDFTGEVPVDAIESALNDPSADIRYEAVSILADIGGERALRALQRALNDPDADVRALAADTLESEQPSAEK